LLAVGLENLPGKKVERQSVRMLIENRDYVPVKTLANGGLTVGEYGPAIRASPRILKLEISHRSREHGRRFTPAVKIPLGFRDHRRGQMNPSHVTETTKGRPRRSSGRRREAFKPHRPQRASIAGTAPTLEEGLLSPQQPSARTHFANRNGSAWRSVGMARLAVQGEQSVSAVLPVASRDLSIPSRRSRRLWGC